MTKEESPRSSRSRRKPSSLYEKLWPEQREIYEVARSQNGFALLAEQRVGKTYIAGALVEEREPDGVIVVALKTNLRSPWAEFFEEYLPDYQIFYDWDAFRKAGGLKVFLVNYESFHKHVDKVVRFGKTRDVMIIFDEAQKLANRGSRNSRLARKLRHITWRLALTGTPMDDSPIDLWGIMRFVEPTALGIDWSPFVSKYCRKTGYMGHDVVFRDTMEREFTRKIKPYVLRVTKEEAGVLRANVKWIPVKMVGTQRRLYDQFEQDMVLKVRGAKIKAPLKITHIGKLQQMTGGQVKDEDGEWIVIGHAKERALRKLLETLEPPVVVFCKFKPEIRVIRRVLYERSTRVGTITGAIKDRKRNLRRTRVIHKLQRGELDYLVCQQQTGGVGVDYSIANHGVAYSYSHSWRDFDQMTSRLDNKARKKAATFWCLFVPHTVDNDIKDAIGNKATVTSVTLNRLRRRK